MILWQWLAAIGAAVCVATVLFFCCVLVCRRSSSSYEVSKAVMSQQAPELTVYWHRASAVPVFTIDRQRFDAALARQWNITGTAPAPATLIRTRKTV